MKTSFLLILITAVLSTSCKGQEQLVFESQDVVKETQEEEKEVQEDLQEEEDIQDEEKEEEQEVPSIALESILGSTKWAHLKNTTQITRYRVDSVLVDEKTKEYGRIIKRIDSVAQDQVPAFLSEITRLRNYPVTEQPMAGFNPNLQFELCADNCELSLLLDSKTSKVGFINLEGQEVVTISKKLNAFLSSTPSNKTTNDN